MPTLAATVQDPTVRDALAFFQALLGNAFPRECAVRLWEGSTWGAAPGEAAYTLVIRHPGALRKMFLPANQLTLGEAYIFDDYDIEGDIEAAFALGDYFFDHSPRLIEKLRLGKFLLGLPGRRPEAREHRGTRLKGAAHSKSRDAQAVTYHYNVSNDFYRLWLDERMAYSCAYFAASGEDLDTAQERKLDYLCRKLRLQRGRAPARHRLRLGRVGHSCSAALRGEGAGDHPQRATGRARQRTPAAGRPGRLLPGGGAGLP